MSEGAWIRRIGCVNLMLILLTGLAGCSESLEHRVQRAQIALSSGKPDLALELAEAILREKPEYEEALLIKAQAQLRLLQLLPAHQTLKQLIQLHPEKEQARRLMAGWAGLYLENLLGQSDLLENAEKQAAFQQALAEGREQAQWLESHGGAAESQFILARLELLEASRCQAMAGYLRRRLSPSLSEQESQPILLEIQKLEQTATENTRQARQRLETALRNDPRHFEAAGMLLDLLLQDRDYAAVRTLAEQLAEEKDLSVTLAGRVVLALLSLPADSQPGEQNVTLARKILDQVDAPRRRTAMYQLAQARLALRSNDPDAALRALEAVLAQEPANVTARYLKAQCLWMQKKLDEARKVLAQLSSEVRSSEVQILYGLVLAELNEPVLAREAFKRAIDLNPSDPVPQRHLTLLLVRQGQLDEAAASLEAFYRANPTDPQAIAMKLQFDISRGRRDAVASLVAQVRNVQPLTAEHLALLTDGLSFLGRFDEALECVRQWAKEQPDRLQPRLRMAQLLLLLAQSQEARNVLEEAHRQFPDLPPVPQMLAEACLQAGLPAQAMEFLNELAEDTAQSTAVALLRARALAAAGQLEEALSLLQELLEAEPHLVAAHALAARIYQATGRFDKANEHLAGIDPAEVNETTDPALAAQIRLSLGQLDQAADICHRAIAWGAADPALRQILAVIHLRKNQPALAEANLLALARLQPNNAAVFEALARFYVEQNLIEKGLVELAGLQSLNETQARLAQARVLGAAGRPEQAIEKLEPIYPALIRQKDPRALEVADQLARLYLAARNRSEAALEVYRRLIDAGFLSVWAQLRQIDLTATTDGSARTLEKLDALADQLRPSSIAEDRNVLLEIVRRYNQLQSPERAIRLIQWWLEHEPSNPNLYRLKAEQQLRAGQFGSAVATLYEAIQRWPEDTRFVRQLALTYAAAADYRRAREVFLQLAERGGSAQRTALVDLGQMFLAIGLYEQAAETFRELEKSQKIGDAPTLLGLGRTLLALGQAEQAAEYLSRIPAYAPQYAQGQLLLARIDQAAGHFEQARQRIRNLTEDPLRAAAAAAELLRMDLRQPAIQELAAWLDAELNLEKLPHAVHRAWLNVRVKLSDQRRDPERLLATLAQLSRLYPNAHQLLAGRMLVLARLNQAEQARQFFTMRPELRTSLYGPLLLAFLEQPVELPENYPAWEGLLVWLSQGQISQARYLVSKIAPAPGVFPSDVKELLIRPDLDTPAMRQAARLLCGAAAARHCTVFQLAADLARQAIQVQPEFLPAWGLLLQTLQDMGLSSDQPLDPPFSGLPARVQQSAAGLLWGATEATRSRNHSRAVEFLENLRQREPDNEHVIYALTQALHLAGRIDQALELLSELHLRTRSYASAVENDLAYLLAEHRPERLTEALALAREAYQAEPGNPAMLDTLGWIEHLSGRHMEALSLLNRAVLSLSDIPDVHYHLGKTYAGLGDLTWARFHLQRAAAFADHPAAQRARQALEKLPAVSTP